MNGKWTKEKFEEHHEKHPEIWELFVIFALQAAKVRKHFSAKCIFHRVRWESQIVEDNAKYKIDDGWIAHYARKFMDEFPAHEGFFETRVRKESYHNE